MIKESESSEKNFIAKVKKHCSGWVEAGEYEMPIENVFPFESVYLEQRRKAKWVRILDREDSAFREMLHMCESPIERMFITAFDILDVAESTDYMVPHCEQPTPNTFSFMQIETQAEIGKYRCDFRLTLSEHSARNGIDRVTVIVECDGHDFHEKTKEQVARDKKRDRAIMTVGVPLLRFTGSEIYADPFKCAKEVADFMTTTMKRLKVVDPVKLPTRVQDS